jgi:hypothetical protein
MTLIPELERELTTAIARQSSRRPRHISRLALVAATMAAMLVGAAVALAAGLIKFGAPVTLPGAMHRNPNVGEGVVRPGTVELSPIRVADPAGGLPWGLRVSSTTRGLGCLQVGRVLNGQLGVLGRDGAFHNDGRFHPLPVSLNGPGQCAQLDANQRLFYNVSASDIPASGPAYFEGCDAPRFTFGVPRSKLCAQSDERNIYFGLLGPEAVSLSYTVGGQTHTLATVGASGAYLIVAEAANHDFNGTTGYVYPVDSPITKVTYRGGITCRFGPRGAIGASPPCPTPGYAPAVTPHPSTAQLATPIHARVTRDPSEGWEPVVSFAARVPVTNALTAYQVALYPANGGSNRWPPRGGLEGAPTQRNIRAGQRVVVRFHGQQQPGLYRGIVTYGSSPTPGTIGYPGQGVLVGRFSIRIP